MKYNLALTKIEREVLYRKYKQNGFTSNEANDKVEIFNNQLSNMSRRLVKNNKTPKEIEKKFQQQFETMCRKLEV